MVTSATFETLVTPHLTDLRRFALHLERDPVRGDDLLQHALERGLKRLHQLRDPGAFKGPQAAHHTSPNVFCVAWELANASKPINFSIFFVHLLLNTIQERRCFCVAAALWEAQCASR